MNTENRKPLIMLDTEAADKTNLTIGETVEYTLDGGLRNDKIVDRTAFSVTVQQPTCKLTIPIEYTTAYKLEKEKLTMARPKSTGAMPSRGKQSQPPAQHPSELRQTMPGHDAAGNLMLPPGSPVMPTVSFQMPTMLPTGMVLNADMGTEVTVAENRVAPREVTIQQVQGDPDWIGKAIDDMVGLFTDSITTLVENAVKEATDNAKPDYDKPKTCFQCVHIDIEGNKCARFNTLPPLFVLVAPEGKCADFLDGSTEIPM